MAYLTSRPEIKTILLQICFLIASLAHKASSETNEATLAHLINEFKPTCSFPPETLKIPSTCSKLTLSATVPRDLRTANNVEFYLCAGLLDSTQRLCNIAKKDKRFAELAASKLRENLPNLTLPNEEPTLCADMKTNLDMTTNMEQAKFIYNRMESPYCLSICVGLSDEDSALRQPLCKSIKFAHLLVRTAKDIQASLNKQAHQQDVAENEEKPINGEPQGNAVTSTAGESQVKSAVVAHKTAGNRNQVVSQPSKIVLSQTDQSSHSPPETKLLVTSHPPIISSKVAEATLVPVEEGTESKSNNPKQLEKNSDIPLGQSIDGLEDNNQGKSEQSYLDANRETQDDHQIEGETQNDPQDSYHGPDTRIGGNDDTQDDEGQDDEQIVNNKPEIGDTTEKSPLVGKKSPINDVLIPVSQEKPTHDMINGDFVFKETEDSHFFAYFMSMSALVVLGYLIYHNKRKIIAMAVEGKKGRNQGRRRPNSASYHKLDSNLEEAMSSNVASTNSYVIY